MIDTAEKDGAGEGTRTPDPIITNDVLYQLSYTGILLCRSRAVGHPVLDAPRLAGLLAGLSGEV